MLLPVMFWPKVGVEKARKLGARLKIFLSPEMVQVYGNISADICRVMQLVGQEGHYLSMCILPSL